MRRLLIGVILLLLVQAGCYEFSPADKGFTVKYDDFDGTTLCTLAHTPIRLTGIEPDYMGECTIWPYSYKDSEETEWRFVLLLSYEANNWLFLEDENTLALKIDGERFDLSPISIERDTSTATSWGVGIVETCLFHVSLHLFHLIANAEEIEVRVYGREGTRDYLFPKRVIQQFMIFVEGYKQYLLEDQVVEPD